MMNRDSSFANRYISQIYRLSLRFFAKRLDSFSFDAGQLPFLLALFRGDGVTQEHLAADLGMDKGTTARNVAQLEAKGFVTRKNGETDKRENRVFLTEKALLQKNDVMQIAKALRDRQFEGFTPKEAEQAREYLIRIRDNMYKTMQEENKA